MTPLENSWFPETTVIPDRVRVLHGRFVERYARLGRRIYTEDRMAKAAVDVVKRAYEATVGAPALQRRVRVLQEWAERMPVDLDPAALLVGDQTFGYGWGWPGREALSALGYATNIGHIVHDYAVLLRLGNRGLLGQIAERRRGGGSPSALDTLDAFAAAVEAFRRFIARHAEAAATLPGGEWKDRAVSLFHLQDEPPRTFAEALQLVWFSQVFLHAENAQAAISWGRLDQYLWPFLRDDLAAGRASADDAVGLLAAFYLKCCEGEESQNLVVGGVDATGRDVTNPLSVLCLDVMRELKVMQPSLCVRWHEAAPARFKAAACRLAAAGTGQPGFISDTAAIAGLQAVDIPLDRARDWAVVGCYEATTQGDCYPNTVISSFHLPKILGDYLGTDGCRHAGSFDVFMEGWLSFARTVYLEKTLPDCQARWNGIRDSAPSPFGSVLMQPCVGSAALLEAGGARFNLAGVNILGLGTLVDSLHAIRRAVFEQRWVTLDALFDAVRDNFPDDGLRVRLRSLAGRYGTDNAATGGLVRDVSTALARMVLESRLEAGVRPYPGFFLFSGDIYNADMATPDGRRRGELISYGVGPAADVVTSATGVLRSAANAAQGLAACGSPLSLSLCPADVTGAAGEARLWQLVDSYFAMGGFHVHFNVVSADQLREAQQQPGRHGGVTVRVSGYSARFVTMDPRWQDALIARIEDGM